MINLYTTAFFLRITQLQNDRVVSDVVSFDLWCDRSDMRKERFVDSHV